MGATNVVDRTQAMASRTCSRGSCSSVQRWSRILLCSMSVLMKRGHTTSIPKRNDKICREDTSSVLLTVLSGSSSDTVIFQLASVLCDYLEKGKIITDEYYAGQETCSRKNVEGS